MFQSNAAISCFPYAVHDSFNWLTVLILLPIEVASGYLYHMTEAIVKGIEHNPDSENPQFLKVITVPFTSRIMQVSSSPRSSRKLLCILIKVL